MSSSFQRACPVCGGTECSELLRKHELRLVQCGTCAMVFANPVPAELASGEFYDQLATPFYLSPDKLAGDYSPVRFDRELNLFRRFCVSGRVLDVGCSTGAFLHQLQQRFGADYQTLGVDVSGPALDYAEKQGVPVLKESYLTANLPKQSFAAVTFWAVLEHLVEPGIFLKKAAALLAPGGHCFVLVPNFWSLAVRLLGVRYRYILPQHVNYFTSTTLQRLAMSNGYFRMVYSGTTHFNPLVILQDWRGNGRPVPDEERARLLKKTTACKQHPLLKPGKVLLSGVENALGKMALADNLVLVLEKVR